MTGYEFSPSPEPPVIGTSSDSGPHNRAGRASLIVAIVQVVLELWRQWIFQIQLLVPRDASPNYRLITTLDGVLSVLVGAVALTALFLGIVGLRDSSGRKRAAAAGAAIGATTLLMLLSAGASSLVAQL